MAIWSNRAEGGTAATTVTQGSGGNSGGVSGRFFDQVVIGTGASLTFNASAAARGALGYRIGIGTTTSFLRWDLTETGTRLVMRRSVKVPSGTSGVGPLVLGQVRNTSSALMCSLIMRDRRCRLSPAGTEHAGSASAGQLAFDTVYWWEVAVTVGGTTSTGRAEHRILNDDGSVWHSYDTGATVNTTIINPGQVRFGGFLSSEITGWTTDDMDDLRAGMLGSGWLGEVPSVPVQNSQAVRRASTR